jgi:hypothetical protein
MTVLAKLFASMASCKRPNAILGGEEIVEVHADVLPDILDGVPDDCSQSSSVIINERISVQVAVNIVVIL